MASIYVWLERESDVPNAIVRRTTLFVFRTKMNSILGDLRRFSTKVQDFHIVGSGLKLRFQRYENRQIPWRNDEDWQKKNCKCIHLHSSSSSFSSAWASAIVCQFGWIKMLWRWRFLCRHLRIMDANVAICFWFGKIPNWTQFHHDTARKDRLPSSRDGTGGSWAHKLS